MRKNLRELRHVAAALLVSTSLLTETAAHAMEIEKFDKMDGRDQGEYIVVLIEGAQQVLIKEGKTDLAAKVMRSLRPRYRATTPRWAWLSVRAIWRGARLADIRRLQKDPSATRLEVEDAMAGTLEKNGIPLPDTFFTVASGFHPKYPAKR